MRGCAYVSSSLVSIQIFSCKYRKRTVSFDVVFCARESRRANFLLHVLHCGDVLLWISHLNRNDFRFFFLIVSTRLWQMIGPSSESQCKAVCSVDVSGAVRAFVDPNPRFRSSTSRDSIGVLSQRVCPERGVLTWSANERCIDGDLSFKLILLSNGVHEKLFRYHFSLLVGEELSAFKSAVICQLKIISSVFWICCVTSSDDGIISAATATVDSVGSSIGSMMLRIFSTAVSFKPQGDSLIPLWHCEIVLRAFVSMPAILFKAILPLWSCWMIPFGAIPASIKNLNLWSVNSHLILNLYELSRSTMQFGHTNFGRLSLKCICME